MRTLHTSCVLVALTLVCASARAAAQTKVWKVGGAAPSFPDIQSAVNAAQDGDLILVRNGTYAGFQWNDKGLSILAVPNANVIVNSQVNLTNLAAGKLAVLANIHCNTAQSPTFVAQNNQGAIVLRANFTSGGSNQWPAGKTVSLTTSAIVVIDSCAVLGGNGNYFSSSYHGATGLFARSSNVAVFQSTLTGGNGFSAPCDTQFEGYPGGDGGAGVECPEGFLFTAGSTFQGGRGGDGGDEDWDPFTQTGEYGQGGRGGDGAKLGSVPASGAPPRIENLATNVAFGAGGAGCGIPGANGLPYQILQGSVGTLPGTSCKITAQKVVHEGSFVFVTATGTAGEAVYLTVSRRAKFEFDASMSGCKLLEARRYPNGIFLGVVPASGVLQGVLPIGALPALDETRTFLVQATFVAPGGAMRLSNATPLAVVDPAIPLN